MDSLEMLCRIIGSLGLVAEPLRRLPGRVNDRIAVMLLLQPIRHDAQFGGIAGGGGRSGGCDVGVPHLQPQRPIRRYGGRRHGRAIWRRHIAHAIDPRLVKGWIAGHLKVGLDGGDDGLIEAHGGDVVGHGSCSRARRMVSRIGLS